MTPIAKYVLVPCRYSRTRRRGFAHHRECKLTTATGNRLRISVPFTECRNEQGHVVAVDRPVGRVESLGFVEAQVLRNQDEDTVWLLFSDCSMALFAHKDLQPIETPELSSADTKPTHDAP